MGVVYAAVDQKTGRTFAIKRLFPSAMSSQTALARFIAEARVTARIDHPNVIGVIDIGNDEDSLFIVMERLLGESLAQRLSRGPISIGEMLDIAIGACAGIAEAHAEGVIHRDLKPDNVFLCVGKDGSPRPPKVLDFGIAKLFEGESLQDQITKSGYFVGTPGYMPREQIDSPRDIDVRADVYAMGIVLYEALTGCLPYRATGLYDLVQQVSAGKATSIRHLAPEVPAELEAIVMRAMSASREDRHSSMNELIAELKAVRPRFGVSLPTQRADVRDPSLELAPTQDAAAGAAPPRAPAPAIPPLPSAVAFADVAPRPPKQSRHRNAPRALAHPRGASRSSSIVLVVAVASAIVVLGALVAGASLAAWIFYRDGSARDGSDAPQVGADPRSPRIELDFSGDCDPAFQNRSAVIYNSPMPGEAALSIVARDTGGNPINQIYVHRFDSTTERRFDLANRDSPRAPVELFIVQDGERWDSGNGSGILEFAEWEPTQGRMDLTFDDVALVMRGTSSVCRVDGRIRTYGLGWGD